MNRTKSSKPDIYRLIELQKLLISFSAIDRMTYIPPDAKIPESNVQHTFSMAMLAWFLTPHFPNLDARKVVQLCLAHDVLEVYAGDNFSFDEQAVKGRAKKEDAAIARLKKDWADFTGLNEAIEEFEARQTSEAKFVTALDRLHPVILDYMCGGLTWHKFGITFDRLMAVKDHEMAISPEVAEYYHQLKDKLVKESSLFPASELAK